MIRTGTTFELKRQQQSNALSAVGIGREKLLFRNVLLKAMSDSDINYCPFLVKDIKKGTPDVRGHSPFGFVDLEREVVRYLSFDPNRLAYVPHVWAYRLLGQYVNEHFTCNPNAQRHTATASFFGESLHIDVYCNENVRAAHCSSMPSSKSTYSLNRIYFEL